MTLNVKARKSFLITYYPKQATFLPLRQVWDFIAHMWADWQNTVLMFIIAWQTIWHESESRIFIKCLMIMRALQSYHFCMIFVKLIAINHRSKCKRREWSMANGTDLLMERRSPIRPWRKISIYYFGLYASDTRRIFCNTLSYGILRNWRQKRYWYRFWKVPFGVCAFNGRYGSYILYRW